MISWLSGVRAALTHSAPQRRPIRLTPGTGERIEALWKEGNEYAAYALQWAEVYRWVDAQGRTNFSNSAPPAGVNSLR